MLKLKMNYLFLLLNFFPLNLLSGTHEKIQKSPEFDTSLFDKEFRNSRKRNFEKHLGDYIIRISRPPELSMGEDFEITKKGKIVFPIDESDMYESYYLISQSTAENKKYLLNLFGKENTQIAVEAWGGGSMGPGYLLIFDLTNDLKKIATLDTGRVDSPKFKDLDGDGIPEIIVEETLYGTEFGCTACHPHGKVILKYKNGEYIVAENLMHEPEPADSHISKHIDEWQKEIRESESPTKFYQALTTFIYTGHADQARRFIDRVWPDDVDGKGEFIKDYRESLSESHYLAKAAKELE